MEGFCLLDYEQRCTLCHNHAHESELFLYRFLYVYIDSVNPRLIPSHTINVYYDSKATPSKDDYKANPPQASLRSFLNNNQSPMNTPPDLLLSLFHPNTPQNPLKSPPEDPDAILLRPHLVLIRLSPPRHRTCSRKHLLQHIHAHLLPAREKLLIPIPHLPQIPLLREPSNLRLRRPRQPEIRVLRPRKMVPLLVERSQVFLPVRIPRFLDLVSCGR